MRSRVPMFDFSLGRTLQGWDWNCGFHYWNSFLFRSRSTSSVKQHSQWQRFEHRMRRVAEAADDNLRVCNNDACDCSCEEGRVVLTTSQAPTQACSCTSCGPGRSGCTIHIFLHGVPLLSYLQSFRASEVKCEDCAGGHDALMQCVERRQRSRSRSRRSSVANLRDVVTLLQNLIRFREAVTAL